MTSDTTYKDIPQIPVAKRKGGSPKDIAIGDLETGVIYPTASGKFLYIDKFEKDGEKSKATLCFFDATDKTPQGSYRIKNLRTLEFQQGDGYSMKEAELKNLLKDTVAYEPRKKISINGQSPSALPNYLKNALPVSEADVLKGINLDPQNDSAFVEDMKTQTAEIREAEKTTRARKAKEQEEYEAGSSHDGPQRVIVDGEVTQRIEANKEAVAFKAVSSVTLLGAMAVAAWAFIARKPKTPEVAETTEGRTAEEAAAAPEKESWVKKLATPAALAVGVGGTALLALRSHNKSTERS